jgi:L-ascorbate oxidase
VWQSERVYSPYLVNIYENGQAAIPDYDMALRYYGCDPATLAPHPAKVGEVLDIVWLSRVDWISSPSMLTGHYWDLGGGNGTYNAADNEEKFQTGYVPVKRDTTMLYRYYAASGVTYDRWMEGLEGQASEPWDMGDALSHFLRI